MINQFSYYLKRNSLKKPLNYIIFVTAACNSRCRHCFYWRNLNPKSRRQLSFRELKRFSSQIGRVRSLSLTGGEPFLRKDFAKIVLLFSQKNQPEQIDIPTNGLLSAKITAETEAFLKARLPVEYSLNLSLDGLKKTHDYIRGVPGGFEKVFKTYQALIPLRQKYGLKIKVTTTLSNKNIRQVKSLGLYVKKKMPQVSFHNFEIMRGNPSDKEFSPPSLEQLVKARPLIFNLWKSYQFYNQPFKSRVAFQLKQHVFNTYLRIIKEQRQVVPCLAWALDAVLDEKGNLYFCELTPKIGNIRKKSLAKILGSREAQERRASIRNKECFCTHSCFMQKSIFLNPWYYYRFFLDKVYK